MSDDFMLKAVLNMPLPDDPAELDIVTWMQVRGRMNDAAARIEELTRERDDFRDKLRIGAHMRWIEADRDRLAGLLKEAVEAGNRLSFAAQTTGGTAGRDEGLVAAIDGWSALLARLEQD